MFFLNAVVPLDGRFYTVRLESTADRALYKHFVLPEVAVRANETAHFVRLPFNPLVRSA